MSALAGALAVLLVRLDALEAAIRGHDWKDVETQYDRVRRATTKARDVALVYTRE